MRNIWSGTTLGMAAPLLLFAVAVGVALIANADEATNAQHLDPSAWGGDHVGKPLPAYVTGDECLFCHRQTGGNWGENRHQLTIRSVSPDDSAIGELRKLPQGSILADATTYLMGNRRMTRFLKRSNDYGKLELLTSSFVPARVGGGNAAAASQTRAGKLLHSQPAVWENRTFADRCAGCHTTAVEIPACAFAALSLDCYTCHGDVDVAHSKGSTPVLLSKKNKPAREVISICGQCHLRGGKSQSTGLPYAHQFVAGDNLFRDFKVNLSNESIRALSVPDQHIYQNARDVVEAGELTIDCLTCHDVHRQRADKHRDLQASALCSACHLGESNQSKLQVEMLPSNRLTTHNRTCDY